MKSKKPFFSRELIYNNVKRFWWISVLFILALFLVSPLVTLTNGSDTIPKSGYNINFQDIFTGTIVFLFTVPVFIGVMVFRYMQNPKSMVALHAMPYTRLRLYVNNIISGLILLIVPILLNAAFLSVIHLGNLGGTYFKEGIVLRYLGTSLLTSISLYFWTVFVGMFTGSSIAQIIFTYILNFLFAGLAMVSQYLLSGVLYGFVMNEEFCLNCLHISPLAQIMFLLDSSPEWGLGYFLIIDIIICVIALVAGYVVYKYRNLENAGDVVSGKYVKPLFKYGVTTCVMLVGALYVREIFSIDRLNIFIYILFALIGYVVAEMLIRKSFKIWDSYKGFLIFSVVFIIISLGINADLFGYENYVPELVGVKSASISSSNPNFKESTIENPGYGILYDKANIEKVINLHSAIVEDKNINLTEKVYTDMVHISYELLDGRVVKRAYEFEMGKYTDLINKVKDSKEYIVSTDEIFDYEASDIYSMRISNALLRGDNYIGIADKAEIEKLFEAMKKDIINTTTDEKTQYKNIYRIELTLKQKQDSKADVVTYETRNYEEKVPEGAIFMYEYFNINAENVNNYMVDNGYKDVLINNDDITSIALHYYKNDNHERKLITSAEKIDEIMGHLYFSVNDPYYKYEDYVEIEINFGNGDSRWTDLAYDREFVKLFED